MNDIGTITLRPVSDNDREFLLKVYEASRAFEMQFVNWDDQTKWTFLKHQFDAQHAHYREHYQGAELDIILIDGKPRGRFYVFRGPGQIAIMDITLLPDFRGRGIGSKLIRGLLAEAAKSECSVRVFLETFNPYQPIFAKLGFQIVHDDGVSRRYEWHRA